jgi:hypothetical protein
LLRFYTDAAYGSSTLELVYSSDYDGESNPADYEWFPVPNVTIPLHPDGTGSEEVFIFEDVDLSSLSGSVYMAFRYYSNNEPTRWTVDSFVISSLTINDDLDDDGVLNDVDLCPNTPLGEAVDANGCSYGQLDDDNDGVQNSDDLCADTPEGASVNSDGCAESQLDDDEDGVSNDIDLCAGTPNGETVDANGCSEGQRDDDNDGIKNSDDLCADTPDGSSVDENGCAESQKDDDEDGVSNDVDLCADTPNGEAVDGNGCSEGQRDDDNDGIKNSDDLCADTPDGSTVDENGCAESQKDDDNDGVMNDMDNCPETSEGASVDLNGCAESQLDDDNDGISNADDVCPDTPPGSLVNSEGCVVFTLPADNFTIETISETCPDKNNGILKITAQESHTYEVTINGVHYDFTNALEIDQLAPGTYDFCIGVSGEDFEQCFVAEIEVGTTVSGKAEVNSKKALIRMESGTAPFEVSINGAVVLETYASQFELDVDHGDWITVKTAVSCEGKFEKQVELFEAISAYPNPSHGPVTVAIPFDVNEAAITVFSSSGKLLGRVNSSAKQGRMELDLSAYPTGVYLLKVMLDKPVLLRVVKN